MNLRTDHPVVVLNPHYSGLGIARLLGPKGVRVFGVSAYPDFPGNRSRWLEFIEMPDSLQEPDRLAEALQKLASRLDTPALLLPTRDHDVNFIARFREKLTKQFLLVQPPDEILHRVLNKAELNATAERAGILVPCGVTVRSPAEIDAARGLKYPVVCRPIYAHQWRRQPVWDLVGRTKIVKAETFDELRDFYQRVSPIDPLVGVSEWIPGGERNLLIYGSFNNEGGNPIAFFTGRKRLQLPPLLGTGVVVEALTVPELIEPAQKLIKALQLSGISEVEFKRDERDGQLYLIEINPRHWDQHGVGAAVGVDLTDAAYRYATRQEVEPMEQSNESVCWVADDGYLRHVAKALLHRAPVRDVLEIFGNSRNWAVWDRNDLRPFLHMLKTMI